MMRSARRRKGDFKKSSSPGGCILQIWDLIGDKRFVPRWPDPVSVLFSWFCSLPSLKQGGLWAIAGGVGFSINLITAVYSLMPIGTMEGGAVWKWNQALYVMLFLPMIAFYFFTYMIV